MGFGDFADDAGPDVFAELAVAVLAMALVAHLRGDFGFRGHRAHGAGFADVVADRLLAIDSLAELHRDHRGQGVVMVRRGDEDGVEIPCRPCRTSFGNR